MKGFHNWIMTAVNDNVARRQQSDKLFGETFRKDSPEVAAFLIEERQSEGNASHLEKALSSFISRGFTIVMVNGGNEPTWRISKGVCYSPSVMANIEEMEENFILMGYTIHQSDPDSWIIRGIHQSSEPAQVKDTMGSHDFITHNYSICGVLRTLTE
ncbi:hypothetical protein D6_0169 [Aeromonas phage D6]|uniref:Uncharacterized protein n=1 Tax=Aeromonas phage D6 TaxID=2593322 RepID=A0A514TWB3_9CAUD|nr:hypothetical protein PQC08_gp106 [Aeromonas phage D6]QDJ97327.1 hypothetical protein D6_0169 [Aeromonas phage D6]